MKKLLLVVFLSCAGYGIAGAAQPLVCTQKGATFERANYDSKGKLAGYTQMVVEQCDSTADGVCVKNRTFSLDSQRKPVEQKVGERTLPAEQTEQIIVRPSEMVIPLGSADLPSVEGVEASFSGDEYTIPYALEPGQALPDIHFSFTMSSDGHSMSIKMTIDQRKVLARETVVTPAGTFEAFKVSERMTFKLFIIKESMKTITWYVPGIGAVREEAQRGNGKVESRSELIAFRLPKGV